MPLNRCRMVPLLLLAWLPNLGGCSSSSAGDEARHYGPKVNVANFIGNTAAYKQKTITLWLKVDEPVHRDRGESLRGHAGRNVRFQVAAPGSGPSNLAIFLPPDLAVPDVGFGDEVMVRFACKRGSLSQGNEAVSMEVP